MSGKSPSIGTPGTVVDHVNRRVKGLHASIMSSVEEVVTSLAESILVDQDAIKLLSSMNVRFTARVIGKNLGQIRSFKLPGGINVTEEARIPAFNDLDIIYLGGNSRGRVNILNLENERNLSSAAMQWNPSDVFIEPEGVTFERLSGHVSARDVARLIEIYQLCFIKYLVALNEALIQSAARNSILIVARDKNGEIIASTIGESLQYGPMTLLEISEQVAHPNYRIKGAATGCARRVIEEGRRTLPGPVIPFWEARMWRNVLGMSKPIGLTEYGGILHQHCLISSPPEFTSIDQTKYGSLAVFYAPAQRPGI